MIDYSKWDNIDDSDDEDQSSQPQPAPQQQLSPEQMAQLQAQMQAQANGSMPSAGSNGDAVHKVKPVPTNPEDKTRKQFYHGGQLIYEWDQNLEEVNLYIKPPPGVTAKMLDVSIDVTHIMVSIKGNPPYLNHDMPHKCKKEQSYWTMEDGELHLTLQKMHKAETWTGLFVGHQQLDDVSSTEDRKRIMLERFAEEHPGFDFSNAEFNGNVPDARDFMGGVKYQ